MQFGADDEPPRFIIRRRHTIFALCIRADLNPKIYSDPAEVWVEATDFGAHWVDRLAMDTGIVRLFVSPGRESRYSDRGLHVVEGCTQDAVELASRMAIAGVDRLMCVVFLRRLGTD